MSLGLCCFSAACFSSEGADNYPLISEAAAIMLFFFHFGIKFRNILKSKITLYANSLKECLKGWSEHRPSGRLSRLWKAGAHGYLNEFSNEFVIIRTWVEHRMDSIRYQKSLKAPSI